MLGNMSEYNEEHLLGRLRAALPSVEHLEVKDVSDGCGGKFEALIVSAAFEGKPLLARHRMVNDILAEELKTIHAFSQKTYTPKQWEEKKAAN